ncbi:MAG TPA: formylglycine-generating enzyme family protein [Gemmataceae bacterium]|jgi:formylglycine-generating enzyme required for sulfatase activity|nr:formylglycine-generating enzyme family protein [Gemmataceae bacterium]
MQTALLLLTLAADPTRAKVDAHENYVEHVYDTNIAFPMIAVRGGVFYQGSPISEPGRHDNEGPRHRVELRPFWMGKYEVTWPEFYAFMREKDFNITDRPLRPALNPRQAKADAVSKPTKPYIDETHGFGDDHYPAFDMSHHAAMKYCEWLSAKTGRTYRLPTEAEWEFACRAGSNEMYPFGKDAERLDEFAWFVKNSATAEHPKGSTHPVGKKRPNAWGLHDMLGNVMEWCLDEYDADFYDTLPWDRTPLGPVNLPGKLQYPHVARGGSFRSVAADCRCAMRDRSVKSWNGWDPEEPQSIWWIVPGNRVGFRVVRPVDDYPLLKGIKSEVVKGHGE